MIIQIDIARLLITNALEHLKLAENLHKKHEIHLINEAEECIQAIILFQSGMEAVITEEIENEKRKRVENFESKVYVLKDTKIDEAKEKTEKIIRKMRKNCDDACDLVFNRFLDNIKNSN